MHAASKSSHLPQFSPANIIAEQNDKRGCKRTAEVVKWEKMGGGGDMHQHGKVTAADYGLAHAQRIDNKHLGNERGRA